VFTTGEVSLCILARSLPYKNELPKKMPRKNNSITAQRLTSGNSLILYVVFWFH